MSLSNEQCRTKAFLIDLNPAKLKYYMFVISLDKCDGSSYFADDLSAKIYVSNETNSVNVKVFDMMTRTNEAKLLLKHISCNC